VIFETNEKVIGEVMKMGKKRDALNKILEEAGFFAMAEAKGIVKGEAIGEARGEVKGKTIGEAKGKEIAKTEIAKKMIENGYSLKETAKLSGLNAKKIKALAGTQV